MQDHVERHHAGAVVAAHRRRERGEIRIRHHRVAHVVDGTGVPLAAHELVRPQHVILPRREDRSRDLEREIGAAHVRERIAIGERVTDDPSDQRVHLDLFVVLIEGEREIHRQPDAPRIARALDDRAHWRRDRAEPCRKRGRDAWPLVRRDAG